MSKPTVHDIAREAGVSLATVDRVLNARPGVRTKTVERVQAAVRRLGYVRNTHAANLARQRQYRFAFVLPEGPSQFVETLRLSLAETLDAKTDERLTVTVVPAPANDPYTVVRTLKRLSHSRTDGVALMLPETPQVRDAVARMKSAGMAVVTLVSDLPHAPRDHFVGINSYSAGRTAAQLMGRFIGDRGGDVLVVTNTLQARDSLERRLGFDAVMAAEFGQLRAMPTVEAYDDPDRMRQIVERVVSGNPRIAGAYSMGSGNTPLLQGLRASGRIGDLVVVAHELTPVTRQALVAREIDAVINQNVGHLVRSALRVLRARADRTPIFEAQERIRTDIVIRENLP
ncbi:MAG: LacI family DNA-binding transcriptional regulator [Pseudomonadota bacterium]